jgi:hypothetical protein
MPKGRGVSTIIYIMISSVSMIIMITNTTKNSIKHDNKIKTIIINTSMISKFSIITKEQR